MSKSFNFGHDGQKHEGTQYTGSTESQASLIGIMMNVVARNPMVVLQFVDEFPIHGMLSVSRVWSPDSLNNDLHGDCSVLSRCAVGPVYQG